MQKRDSGWGTVGKVAASDTRGPGFESSNHQLLLNNYFLLTVCRKDVNKEEEAENGPVLNICRTGDNGCSTVGKAVDSDTEV